jgi:gamma-tubulin complex component 4
VAFVRTCRTQVASRLWQLVVVDSRLVDHLAALKDYLLLAKGDFYQSFLSDAAKLLMLPADKVVPKDLGEQIQLAASTS